jgi:hypothetical protein
MRPLVVRHRILIVVAVVIVAIGGLWWTKTIAFTRSSPVAFTAETFVYVPRGDPSDITPTVIAAFPFSNDEIVRLVAERIVNTYGGNRSEYASSLTIKDTTAVAGKVVYARGRTPLSTQRIANYGAEALCDLVNAAVLSISSDRRGRLRLALNNREAVHGARGAHLP